MATLNERFAIIGLGYVGLPVAYAFARLSPETIGFDVDPERIGELKAGVDRNGEFDRQGLTERPPVLTSEADDLAAATFYIVAVPTPVDARRQPDLSALRAACATVGAVLTPGDVVVFESTVYPGLTEGVCGPLLAEASGLAAGADFTLGYSPERINPGDGEHAFEQVIKVVAGQDEATLQRVARAYEGVVAAGVHRAPSIQVAEAAKIIENTQRDINIALMNELAVIFDRLGIRTKDVLTAARTKWNFVNFTPGLVGGHCIGIDPYYLAARAQEVGYHPQMILAGRQLNDEMSAFVARTLVKLLAGRGRPVAGARVGILGITFKSDVADIRNSKVPEMIAELEAFNIEAIVHDPLADPRTVHGEYAIALSERSDFHDLDVLVLAVPHGDYLREGAEALAASLAPGGLFMDLKSAIEPDDLPAGLDYWSL